MAASEAENDWYERLSDALESRTHRGGNDPGPPADVRVLLGRRHIARNPDNTFAAVSALRATLRRRSRLPLIESSSAAESVRPTLNAQGLHDEPLRRQFCWLAWLFE